MNSFLNPKIVIRCDGGVRLGLGHIYRCLALAAEFASRDCSIIFALLEDATGVQIIEDAGFVVLQKSDDKTEEEWLDNILSSQNAHALICDIRTDLPSSALLHWQEKEYLVAIIDDASERRLTAKFAFFPPAPQVANLDFSNAYGECFCGWEYVILRQQFNGNHLRTPQKDGVVICMGGSDPKEFTFKALAIIEDGEESLQIKVIIGSAFQKIDKLKRLVANSKHHIKIFQNIKNMAEVLESAEFAICSFGMIAYELASVGTPALYYCLSDDHRQHASRFVNENLGNYLKNSTKEQLAQLKLWLAGEHPKFSPRSDIAGAKNIADKIIGSLKEKIDE